MADASDEQRVTISWPTTAMTSFNIEADLRKAAVDFLNDVGERLAIGLENDGIRRQASVMFRPFSFAGLLDHDVFAAAFFPATGLPFNRWWDLPNEAVGAEAFFNEMSLNFGSRPSSTITSTRDVVADRAHPARSAAIDFIVEDLRAALDAGLALGQLGDLTGLTHLEPALHRFVADHPNHERTVFVMMRFKETDRHRAIIDTIRTTLAAHGYEAVRADDKAYTEELWSNIQVYATGSRYGIAVFEAIDAEPLNPNVALELGYMMASRKRSLILKEQRLAALPTDVIGHLYKSFDMFAIAETIALRVEEWINVDLV